MTARLSLTLLALAGALLGGTLAANAQSAPYPLPSAPAAGAAQSQGGERGTPRHRPNRMRAALRQLGLSADQKTRIAGMLASFRASRQTSTPMTRKQLMSDIAGILTPDQRTKLHAIMRRRRPGTGQSAPAAT